MIQHCSFNWQKKEQTALKLKIGKMKNLTVVLRFKVCPTAGSRFATPALKLASDRLKLSPTRVGSRGNKNLLL